MKTLFPLAFVLMIFTSCSGGSSEFLKKQECAKYKNDIEREIQENYKDVSDTKNWKLEEIFYSPVEDTCFYVATSENQVDKDLVDFLSKKIVLSKAKGLNVNGEFEIEIQKFKK